MAPHSSTLACKIPWIEEPGGLQSMGSLRVRHNFTFTFHFHALEKEMATHSSVLAWRIPGTEEPGGLPSMGLHRVGHDRRDLAACSLYGLPWWVIGKELTCQCSLICGSGRSPVEGNGNPFQYSCLENPRDRGAWWAAIYGVAQSRTRLKPLSSSSRVN